MTVTDGTYNVFLPESVSGIVQQKFFGHEGAVKPDCTTVNQQRENTVIQKIINRFCVFILSFVVV